MKLAAWNVNSLKVRLPQLLDFLDTRQPDAVCLQETKLTDDAFPVADLEAAGYRVAFAGQKTYNGVAILSRAEPLDVQVGPDPQGAPPRPQRLEVARLALSRLRGRLAH